MGWFSNLFGRSEPARLEQAPKQDATVLRGGKPHSVDDAFRAWTSGDLQRMLKELNTPTHPLDRHFLLLNIVESAYKKRKRDPEMRRLCEQVGRVHVEEFGRLAAVLRKEFRDANGNATLPRVPTFQHLATLLGEDGRIDEAIAICEEALRHGLHDGTQGGFENRIERLRKQKAHPKRHR